VRKFVKIGRELASPHVNEVVVERTFCIGHTPSYMAVSIWSETAMARCAIGTTHSMIVVKIL
jgi:hypothetical protein